MLSEIISPYLWHPLGQCVHQTLGEYIRCRSYNLWSGAGSDLGEITIVGGLATITLGMWHHHNCHEHGCLRLTWHPDEEGHPVCKVHHPDHPACSWFRSDRTHPRHRKAKAHADE